MLNRLMRNQSLWVIAFSLTYLACSGGTAGVGDASGGGDSVSGPDSNLAGDSGGGATGRDSAVATANCTPFAPAIPCAQGTACPAESYCDLKQTLPVCAPLHCSANGVACDNDSFCSSNLCLAGVCTSPVGEGSPCYNQSCDQSLRCLGFPPTCVKPKGIGESCQSDDWCLNAVGYGPGSGSPDAVYCLAGVCGKSYCKGTATSGYCSATTTCSPGYTCSVGGCVQLYCGQDGIPCGQDIECATGFGCVSGLCRKLNVPLHCAGTPAWSDCSRTNLTVPILGCTIVGSSCSGTATDCGIHLFEIGATGACVGQSGCQWNSANSRCTGTATPCSQLSGSSGYCTSTNGCTLSQTTTGSPTPCNQLSTTQCASQIGCQNTDIGVY
jgi:hypothetical protein